MYRGIFIFTTLLFCILNFELVKSDDPRWSWNCINDKCVRNLISKVSKNACQDDLDKNYPSIEVCRLVCGIYSGLYPRPTLHYDYKESLTHINHKDPKLTIVGINEEATQFLKDVFEIFKENLVKDCGKNCSAYGKTLAVNINVHSSSLDLTWETLENYTLKINSNQNEIFADIEAQTIFGARHALESLNQMTGSYKYDEKECPSHLVMVQQANLKDKPFFKHRGLLVDTSRNYLTIKALKRQIDGLSASKMNVLHWHATDSHSFPLKSKKVPELYLYGAYSDKETYSFDEIKELLRYAKLRGVRIIIEIDSPAHAGNGWQWGHKKNLGDLALCVNQDPWRGNCVQPPCGQLNPINPHMYDVLGKLYSEIAETFPKNEVFHMGGDEVNIQCWNTSTEILKYLRKHKKGRYTVSFLDLWGRFHKEAVKRYDKNVGNEDTTFVVWSSQLTDPDNIKKYFSKDRFVVQTWVPYSDELPNKLLSLGYRIIVSTKDAWYLDHGVWGKTMYYNWQDVYNNQLLEDPKVLGGEVCSWGEYVRDQNIDSRNWPRTAAAAERLWTNPASSHIPAQYRFSHHRNRLLARGINADAIWPFYCTQNDGECT